jgi:hypothetical protein
MGTTSTTTNLSWTAATDNVAVTGIMYIEEQLISHSYWDNVCRYRITAATAYTLQ